jgi:deoxyribodipyrimidine photo-lyase
MPRIAIVWLRNDLRLADNPALRKAAAEAAAVVPVYIHAPEEAGRWAQGGATKWWLHHSLAALSEALEYLGSPLILREGNTLDNLLDVIEQSGADSVYWNQAYEPAPRKLEAQVANALNKRGIYCVPNQGNTLLPPDLLLTAKGEPYKVFTPFWRALLAHESDIAPPLPKRHSFDAPPRRISSVKLDALKLLPSIRWDAGIEAAWEPGEHAAHKMLDRLVEDVLMSYERGRNAPSEEHVSRLSPYLHFGELSPRTIWRRLRKHAVTTPGTNKAVDVFLRQIVWREFATYLLYHFPHTAELPLRGEFNDFPWHDNADILKRWQKGQTGYPIVDAGMRELWTTGWMHNRVRMIVASFLVKDLLVPWQRGAEWFWNTLVDADLANNTMGWQWVAGCGADAAPYFRIFNPVLQGEKFDAQGDYVRRWVPELAKLDNKWIHRPWEAPPLVLQTADITLGKTYPEPIVDHAKARGLALSAYSTISRKARAS